MNHLQKYHQMFEDYQISEVLTFPSKVEELCMNELGIFIVKGRRTLTISHIKGCNEPVDLLKYFKEEMKFAYSQCKGLISLTNFSEDKSFCCFGVIMDLDFWCVIVRLQHKQNNEKVCLDIEELKMLSINMEESTIDLRLISGGRKDICVLSEIKSNDGINLIKIVPENHHIDKFSIKRFPQLQFGLENEEALQQFSSFKKKNLIFAFQSNFILIYNQLSSDNNHSQTIFLYGLDSSLEEGTKTYPQYILPLPEYEHERLLSHAQIVEIEDKRIQSSIIICFYQLPEGLEIVECDFQNSKTIKRKFLFQGLQFSEFIYTSITSKSLHLKGVQHCLENHSVLIRSEEGLGLQNNLVLLNLPSTGSPKVSNKVHLHHYFQSFGINSKGFWILESHSLKFVRRISKSQIYHSFLRNLYGGNQIQFDYIQKELQDLLE